MKIDSVKKGTKLTPKKEIIKDYSLLNEGEILTVEKIVNSYSDGKGFVKFEEYPFVYNIDNFREV